MNMNFSENEAVRVLTEVLADARSAKRDLERIAPERFAAWETARDQLKEAAPREFAAWEEHEKPDLGSRKYAVAFQAADPSTFAWLESIDNSHGPAVAAAKAYREISGWKKIARKYHAMMSFFPPMPAYLVAAVAVVWLVIEVRDSDEELQFIQDAAVDAVDLDTLRYTAPKAFENYTRAMAAVAYAEDTGIEVASRNWLVTFNALRTTAPGEFATYEISAIDAAESTEAAGHLPWEYFPD